MQMSSSIVQDVRFSNELLQIKNSDCQNEIRISKTINDLENIIKGYQNEDNKNIFSDQETSSLELEFKQSSGLDDAHQFFKTTLMPNDMNFLKLTLQESNPEIRKSHQKTKTTEKKFRSKTKSLFHISKKKPGKSQSSNTKFKPKSHNKKKGIKGFTNSTIKKKLSVISRKQNNRKALELPKQSNGLLIKQKKTFPMRKKTRKFNKKEDFDKFSQISNFSIKTQKIVS
jgi:hypothetical protein